MKIKIIALKSILISIFLATFSSCVIDRKTTFYIRNCTNDTLLIELSESDTLVDWKYWAKHAEEIIMSDDTKEVETALNNALFGRFVLPDSIIFVDPYIYSHYDTCYLYTIKWNIAKNYSMDEIRTKKLYDRQAVTKKNFHNRLFEYNPTGSAGDH